MRLVWLILLCGIAGAAWALAPRAAYWGAGQHTFLAALDDDTLRIAQLTPNDIHDLAAIPAAHISTITAGQWQGNSTLLGARGNSLLRLDLQQRHWTTLGNLPGNICEIHPSPDGTASALILTGGNGLPVPHDGAVWLVRWGTRFCCSRVREVADNFRPWQLWWTRVAGEQRFAAATYKATPMVKFEHNCMFLFAWHAPKAEKRWLGSRLSRPYVDATHADLRHDGNWRMVAVEEAHEGGYAISVYRPIGFGYEGEWRTGVVPGLLRVAAYGTTVVCWGKDAASGMPLAWALQPEAGNEYHLIPIENPPPSLEALVHLPDSRLVFWWNGRWHICTMPVK
ncbi:MAG TPA: hypothetical protein VHV83_12285 [Armatimonadota bacterium]|nr:hypothetical protein [Armatimonadota bacterium]